MATIRDNDIKQKWARLFINYLFTNDKRTKEARNLWKEYIEFYHKHKKEIDEFVKELNLGLVNKKN